jgi:hypothetical protein
MKHTPANWIVTGNSIDGFVVREEKTNVIIFESNRYLIQAEANAKLIAAAPDLFEALTDLFDDVMYLGFADECHDSFQKASRAVDKATQ